MFKKILSIFFIILLSCKPTKGTDTTPKMEIQTCSLIEEKFENSSMKIFLQKTKNGRQVIDSFLEDKSDIAILSLTGSESIWAKRNKNMGWEVFNKNNSVQLQNNETLSKINQFVNLNVVYKLVCPKKFEIADGNNGFKAIWVKKEGEIKFLYYSTSYDITSLNANDSNKIISLIEIDNLLKESY